MELHYFVDLERLDLVRHKAPKLHIKLVVSEF
jgi:hypothetical protein